MLVLLPLLWVSPGAVFASSIFGMLTSSVDYDLIVACAFSDSTSNDDDN
jgi:hypothetical protein